MFSGKPYTAAFAAGKSAQRMLSQSLARDLGPKNVHVFYVIGKNIPYVTTSKSFYRVTHKDPDALF